MWSEEKEKPGAFVETNGRRGKKKKKKRKKKKKTKQKRNRELLNS